MLQSVNVRTVPILKDGITIEGLAKRLYAEYGIGFRVGIKTVALIADSNYPGRRSYSKEEAGVIEYSLYYSHLVQFTRLENAFRR